MFERMALQRYLFFAQMEARRERAETVRPDHVLLGLRQHKSAVGRLLENVSIDTASVTPAPARTDTTDPTPPPIPHSPDTDRLVQQTHDIGGYLHGRHAAAVAIMQAADAAQRAGEDPDQAMERIHRETMEGRRPGEKWRWHFPIRGGWLKQFREWAPPPSFVHGGRVGS